MVYREEFASKDEAMEREWDLAHMGCDTDIYKEGGDIWIVEWTED